MSASERHRPVSVFARTAGIYLSDSGLPDGIFSKPKKNPLWVNFGGLCNGRCLFILLPFGIHCVHLLYFVVIWYIFPHFGMFYQEKSGNPGPIPLHAPFRGKGRSPRFDFFYF
jgi:hypothetical protein